MADLLIRPGLTIPERDLSWRFSRSSGPGGQSVNTSDSRAELRLDVRGLPEPYRTRALARLEARLIDGGVLAVSSEQERSQLRNRQAAEARLVELLRSATGAPPRRRRATKPTRGSVERRLSAKRRRSGIKKMRGGGGED
ncbi:MAG TPA: alternative ribosome rescue aminoacyl-tRNA hydrolase ArfB [Frankiaceae bacterium]|nr:alternative ribosome rescue aminoacyl-tRNA hydrolase ArfB [Frankiaceae bacterium]